MKNNSNAHQLENGWADWGPPLQWNPIQQQQQEGVSYQHRQQSGVSPKHSACWEHEALVLLGFHWCNILVKAELWEHRWGEWLPGLPDRDLCSGDMRTLLGATESSHSSVWQWPRHRGRSSELLGWRSSCVEIVPQASKIGDFCGYTHR